MGYAVLLMGAAILVLNVTLCAVTNQRRAKVANTVAWCGIAWSIVPIIIGVMIVRTPQ